MEEHDDNAVAKHPCNNESGSLPIQWISLQSQLGIPSGCHMSEKDASADQSCESICGNGSGSRMDLKVPSSDVSLTMQLCEFPSNDLTKEGNTQDLPCIPVGLTSTYGSSGEGENLKHSSISSIRPPRQLPKSSENQQSSHIDRAKECSARNTVRVARPPGEGRGKNQLLPRYWPRITDQELRQIRFANSNSSFTPLFEKMLSASDAGRIGRLVLPKACAEAYFPPISQPEGVPLHIQDVSGKDWIFQFRFWPNNNSRMYVLEGVTPCIQSMNLQAGDTVTFMRLEPEGKLVMGYRRAPSLSNFQDSQPEMGSAEAATSRGNEILNLASVSKKGSIGTCINEQGNLSEIGNSWYKTEKSGQKTRESSCLHSAPAAERKKGRYFGSKSKRLCLEVEESIKLKLSWEEAQELLRPPPNNTPSILTIEGHEFEEYEEPPVFGKRTIFTTRQNGLGEDQWAQCDSCKCWRRVPSDVFLPARWACADNVWDPQRATCNASREIESDEIESLLHNIKEIGEPVVEEQLKVKEAPSGLDALATAATLGENSIVSSTTPAATTKHPRHRPGCTCIVCIQPPSGKGPKHKPNCLCNVCMTVRRRFKTLMMRRKKRQSEREAENARKKWASVKEEELNCETKWQTDNCSFLENGPKRESLAISFPGVRNSLSSHGTDLSLNVSLPRPFSSNLASAKDEYLAGNGQIDLNCQPERHDEPASGSRRMSMVRLLQSATYPLDRYLKQQGLTSLIYCPMVNPSVGFARTARSKKIEELQGSQSAVVAPDRPQEETYLMLCPENGSAITCTENFDIMDRSLSFHLSTQN